MEHFGEDLAIAFPTRKRGLRSITVNGTIFRWRLKAGLTNSTLLIYGSRPEAQLHVTLREWRDHWTTFPFLMSNTPSVITPDFVRQAIEFGMAQGWAPDAKAKDFEVEWRDEEFHLAPRIMSI